MNNRMNKVIFCILTIVVVSCTSTGNTVLDGQITREELVNMRLNEKTKVYLSLSPESKYELWKYKIKDNIHSPYLSMKEKLVMIQLLQTIDKDLWKDTLWSGRDSLRFNKMNEKVKKLLWNEEKKFVFLERFETVDELKVAGFFSKEHKEILLHYSSDEILHFIVFFSEGITVNNGHYSLSVSKQQAKEQLIPREIYKRVEKYISDNNPYCSEVSIEDLVTNALLE